MTEKVMTLQSATGISSPIMIECRDDVVHFTAWTSAETNRAWANPKRADVLAALGIDELGCGCDEADTNLKKALARAEEAEAKLAEAEATIERVRALTECGAHTLTRETIRAALDPKPAFELPTEAGARFEAINKNSRKRYEFTTLTGLKVPVYAANGDPDYIYVQGALEAHYEDFRTLDGDS